MALSLGRKMAVVGGVVLAVGIAAAVALNQEDPAGATTNAPALGARLAGVHRSAADGRLQLIEANRLVKALLDAGFPANRQVPKLDPWAALAGGATVDLGGAMATLAHYRTQGRPLSILCWPRGEGGLPKEAAPVIFQGDKYSVLRDGEVRAVLYLRERWIVAVVTDAPESEAMAQAELVRRAQRS
jgi:hypothetical protein